MNKNNWTPKTGGNCLNDFLLKQNRKLDNADIKNLKIETTSLLSNGVQPNNLSQSKTLFALGYIQSGKTMSMTTLIALAADNGYRMVIVLAGITNVLLDQTFDRLKKDLSDCGHRLQFDINKNPSKNNIDDIQSSLINSDDSDTTICLVILKHHKYLNDLAELFTNSSIKEIVNQKQVIIIDDEADQASLNGLAYRNNSGDFIRNIDDDNDKYDHKKVYKEITSTYKAINNLRDAVGHSTYIQYTATPQSLLFIDALDILSPDYIEILSPGKEYIGGKQFFGRSNIKNHINKIPDDQIFHFRDNPLDSAPDSLVEAVRSFVILIAHCLIKEINAPQSMMVHPHQYNRIAESQLKCAPSQLHYDWIRSIISAMRKDFNKGGHFLNEINEEFQITHKILSKKINTLSSFEDIKKKLKVSLARIKTIPFFGDYKPDEEGLDFNQKSNFYILIGGHKLNRGFTVEGLMVSYMPVSIGSGNADTIQQRCRFLGYKKQYLDLCQVYLPQISISAYIDYVHHEEDIRNKIKSFYDGGGYDIKDLKKEFILSNALELTRSNVLVDRLDRFNMKSWVRFETIDENNSQYNKTIFNNFINENLTNPLSTNNTNSKFKINSLSCVEFLSKLKYDNIGTVQKINTIAHIIGWGIKNEDIKSCYIVHMDDGKIRERSYKNNSGNHDVNNIHVGRRAGYHGDAHEYNKEMFTLQMHHIKPINVPDNLKFDNFYTLAIRTPENFRQNLVSQT